MRLHIKLIVILIFQILIVMNVLSQALIEPSGGGEFKFEDKECVPKELRIKSEILINDNINQLIKSGLIKPISQLQKVNAVQFSWPLKQNSNFKYNSYYGISNYIDNNSEYPKKVLDYNCGSRSYDLDNGYNHSGTDIFLFPFYWNMVYNEQVIVIAAAPGIIVGKFDGNQDKSCGFENNKTDWNALYLRHSDGNVTWYGHMKKFSLTNKIIGDSVAEGEFIGYVGSSGFSSGPHLHFEVHDSKGKILDPWEGPCNKSASLWQNQKPYYEPTINTLLTHSKEMKFNPCPQLDDINAQDTFNCSTKSIIFAAYFHDQQKGELISYKIIRPDGSIFKNWTHSSPDIYLSSYWYWKFDMPMNPEEGLWIFSATYNSNTVNHDFYYNCNVTSFEERNGSFKIFPNPVKNIITIEGLNNIKNWALIDVNGKVVFQSKRTFSENGKSNNIYYQIENNSIDVSGLPIGYYYMLITNSKNNIEEYKLLKQ